jgi:DMSO/TMAO reductase YedYZ molybdopterin-dependent catalytic subunit
VGWTDDSGQNWVGVPLWLLVGEVDDANSHGTGSFNDALADGGYQVDVVGADGFTVTLQSASLKRNGNIIVAYLVNDTELPEKYYPLRLVGSGVAKNQMVGQIDMIVVHVPEAAATVVPTAVPTVAATAAAPAAGSLSISGLVANPLSLSESALRAMSPVMISAEQPKKGTQSFTGVRLNTLLDVAQVQAAATKLVLTAGDGYSAEIDLATVRACADCMIAFTDTPGSFFAVMPGQQGNLWVKDVIKIEVK